MPVNLSLKNVPEAVHVRLQDQAERHGRSMNSEILQILSAATHRSTAVDGLLNELAAFNLRLAGRDLETINIREAIQDRP